MVHIGNDWDELLKDTFASENYQQLRQFLIREYSTHRVYPDMYDLFNALRYTSYADTKAVILGQDPLTTPPMELRNIPVLETIKDGRTIWRLGRKDERI